LGLFDTVFAPCPCCGWFNDFQTKGGECALIEYNLDNAPDDALSCVNDYSPEECKKCGTLYYINIVERKAVKYISGDIRELESQPFVRLLSRYDIAKNGTKL